MNVDFFINLKILPGQHHREKNFNKDQELFCFKIAYKTLFSEMTYYFFSHILSLTDLILSKVENTRPYSKMTVK